MLRIKSVWSYAIHAKELLAISENVENFHVEFAPMLSYRGAGVTQYGQKIKQVLRYACDPHRENRDSYLQC